MHGGEESIERQKRKINRDIRDYDAEVLHVTDAAAQTQ